MIRHYEMFGYGDCIKIKFKKTRFVVDDVSKL